MTEFILVRHGRPEIEIRERGIADPGLDDIGRWQAGRVSRWLAHEPIDRIVTSPKARASQTVVPLVDELGLTPHVIDDLDEIDRFSSRYYPTELVHTEGGEYWEAIQRQEFEAIGWDDISTFIERVTGAWNALAADPGGERVVVACHGGTIRVILGAISGQGMMSVNVDYASISRVVVDGGEARYASINETGHFDADRTGLRGPMGNGLAVDDAFHRAGVTGARPRS